MAGNVKGVVDVYASALQPFVAPRPAEVPVAGTQQHARETPAAVPEEYYVIESGDTLSHIALHYYGSAGRSSYMKIAEANGLADANKIFVGQKLKIPGTTKGPDEVLA